MSDTGDMKLKIMHLYPDLLNLYGDRGNIECMKRRLIWRGIDCGVVSHTCDDSGFDISDTDILFLGGGSDREQKIVCSRLLEHKEAISEFAENGGTIVAVCGGYQLLGRYYRLEDETIEGLGILDIYTEQGEGRLIGNIVLESDIAGYIVGFENHGGRTHIGSHEPLGRVVFGHGNDESSGAEGVVYKNVIATYLHGPLLPKNPRLCDRILKNALEHKYGESVELAALDDALEEKANAYIVQRFVKK